MIDDVCLMRILYFSLIICLALSGLVDAKVDLKEKARNSKATKRPRIYVGFLNNDYYTTRQMDYKFLNSKTVNGHCPKTTLSTIVPKL